MSQDYFQPNPMVNHSALRSPRTQSRLPLFRVLCIRSWTSRSSFRSLVCSSRRVPALVPCLSASSTYPTAKSHCDWNSMHCGKGENNCTMEQPTVLRLYSLLLLFICENIYTGPSLQIVTILCTMRSVPSIPWRIPAL